MKALLLIDLQIDFCTGGALAIQDAESVIPIANQLIPKFELVVATQDWHPANHISFAANHLWRRPNDQIQIDGIEQTLWPMHCVQHSFGAEFAPDLQVDKVHKVVQKGTDSMIDSYSGFYDNSRRKATEMHQYLQAQSVDEVFIMGLATDYCVKYTVLDALTLDYICYLIEDGCKAVNLQADDYTKALAEMTSAGAQIVSSEQVLKGL